jgi:hypothetical protein
VHVEEHIPHTHTHNAHVHTHTHTHIHTYTHTHTNTHTHTHVQAWKSCLKQEGEADELRTVRVLGCLGNVAACVPVKDLSTLAMHLYNCLTNLDATCPPRLTRAMVKTLRRVSEGLEASQAGVSMVERVHLPPWESELLKLCESGLEAYVFRTDVLLSSLLSSLSHRLLRTLNSCMGQKSILCIRNVAELSVHLYYAALWLM